MPCKGVCHHHKPRWISQTLRYANGQKRCASCEQYLVWDGKFCPCCGRLLRHKPRTIKSKQMFVEQKIRLQKIHD
jgi:predicted amidophosphoribosyltransferase